MPPVLDEGLYTESQDFTDATGAGVRIVHCGRGRAFALFAMELGPEGDAGPYDLVALRIGSSLRTVE